MLIDDTLRGDWVVTNLTTGAEEAATGTPTAVLYRNGSVVAAATPAVSTPSTGHYHASVLLDAAHSWAISDHYSLVASWVEPGTGGLSKKQVLSQGRITAAMRGTDLAALADTVEGFFQISLRSDAAITTDRAAILTLINANEGSGAGDYAATTESQEATATNLATVDTNVSDVQDRLPAALVGSRMDSNVSAIDNSNPAAVNLKQSSLALATGTVIADGSNTATTFKIDTTLGAKAADYFGNTSGGMVMAFVDGATNEWQTRRIVGFNTTTDFVTVEEAFDATVAGSDEFILIGRITELT